MHHTRLQRLNHQRCGLAHNHTLEAIDYIPLAREVLGDVDAVLVVVLANEALLNEEHIAGYLPLGKQRFAFTHLAADDERGKFLQRLVVNGKVKSRGKLSGYLYRCHLFGYKKRPPDVWAGAYLILCDVTLRNLLNESRG